MVLLIWASAPEIAVDIDDPAAKEVLEMVDEAGALGVVVEVGLEDVFNVGGIGGNDAADVTENAEGDGVGGAGGEEFGHPVEEVVAVAE
ncbi:hypothetical protein J5N97_016912 [Dioscorea zingiberensis]|uniref:Uncharacterized protein n=1 Tax=Dioscorea zingiberensis TaxID=325984 RepID=A0A9D5CKW2_9LILI|nr:hypothetical protein J5N97_016912 [Dioscorea zingiberensis]